MALATVVSDLGLVRLDCLSGTVIAFMLLLVLQGDCELPVCATHDELQGLRVLAAPGRPNSVVGNGSLPHYFPLISSASVRALVASFPGLRRLIDLRVAGPLTMTFDAGHHHTQ